MKAEKREKTIRRLAEVLARREKTTTKQLTATVRRLWKKEYKNHSDDSLECLIAKIIYS
jgi:hypothetical protein